MPAILIVLVSLLSVLAVVDTILLLGLVPIVERMRRQLALTAVPTIATAIDAPEFTIVDTHGVVINNSTMARGTAGILFVSPTCPSCVTTLAETRAIREKANGNLVVVCNGHDAACRELAKMNHIDEHFVIDTAGAVTRLFGIDKVPTAVLLSDGRTITSRGYPMREELEIALAPS